MRFVVMHIFLINIVSDKIYLFPPIDNLWVPQLTARRFI